MFNKSNAPGKAVCFVCGVSHKQLRKIWKKSERNPKMNMISAGGIMIGVPTGGENMNRCSKCGYCSCTKCQKKRPRGEYGTDYLCPNCDWMFDRDSFLAML